jgi:Asp-tRNA(Asn)/Glu-tRNA(Gln) amidotransferase A subunit family amidase
MVEGPAGRGSWPRREVLGFITGIGVGAVFARSFVTLAAEHPRVTDAMIERAAWISGVDFTDDERKLMLDGVNDLLDEFRQLRAVELDNAVSPALQFRPQIAPLTEPPSVGRTARPGNLVPAQRPASDTDLAFSSVAELSAQLRSGQISSPELTRLYLNRLRRLDPVLECAIGITEELALSQADRADRELAAGHYRGPLHGIPWGAKDLLAVKGYPTTWGAKPFLGQVRDESATVVDRMCDAGAVLIAKLTLGALAWGDVWFGGQTKNPWNTEQGSSGSSAGSASATAAGLVGFAIGSETWGSIVSPCTRCGVSGLRPTFGRVSRHGAMALSWSMDKLGPIARSVEDCALVLDAIRGPDGRDPTVVERPFNWPLGRDPRTLRVGYTPKLFEEDRAAGIEIDDEAQRDREMTRAREWQAIDLKTLDTLRAAGFDLVPIDLPDRYPVSALPFILTAEASAAFDDLTRSGLDDELVRQIERAWPNVFRQGQLIPAVEYIRANRIRTLVLADLQQVMGQVDLYISPSFVGDNLLMTNLTGHPCVVLPNGFRESDGTPTSITLTGGLYDEAAPLAVAHAFQQVTDHHRARPPIAVEEPA